MSLTAGGRLGPYEITAKLGEGGMGEVWRATDSKLGREVALKLLPEDFADDPDRHARFEREAKLLASLNHPNIATLYGLEHLDGKHALAMELVEGEGLDQRIARGAIPLEEAIPIALQIAEALEAAHEAGIVHRDLKPANVRIRPDGTVKVLDFGLAKVWEADVANSSLSLSPTVTRHATVEGVILGTAAYMSPEQARGRPVDKRADIWAFGVVLWEMLTGRQMFSGETVTDVLASVLKQETDWTLLPASTPNTLRHVLRRCLERRPAERVRDIGDVRWELARIAGAGIDEADVADTAPSGQRRGRTALAWIAGAALGVAATALIGLTVLRPHTTPPRAVRSFLVAPENATFDFRASVGGPVLSPDGSKLVFAARDANGASSLWIRPLDSLSAQPLRGTENAYFPFWSPDSRWVGFFVTGKLRKIDVTGGPPETLCDASNGRGGSWSSDGVIVFAPDVFGGLARVSAAGGAPTPLSQTKASRQGYSERWPFFLPDGRHFVYWAGGPLNSGEVKTDGIYLRSLDGGAPRLLFPSDSNALYAPPGYLLYLRTQTLMVQPFDASSGKLGGEAFPIAEDIANPQNYRFGDFSVSQEGTLVYQTGETGLTQLVWLDSAGRQVGTVGDPAAIDGFRMSPDGKFLAEQVSDARSKNVDLWVVDLGRGVRTRFTFDPGLEISPVWSPDGRRIAYTANPKGHMDIYVKNADGSGRARPLIESEVTKYADDWSPDGKTLSMTVVDPRGNTITDIWTVPVEGEHKPKPFVATPFVEGSSVFSPDGRWLAYASNESGRSEVYLTPFPGPGGKWQVSQSGGGEPEWRRDGGALFYRAPDGALFEAKVTATGSAVEVGTPRQLFSAPRTGGSGTGRTYAVSPGGDRYLVLHPIQNSATPLTLVTNWTSALKK
ncbi:MAG: protein kinase [Acidobacteria bacterium]|nr:protein kinase [Acidobacteriota bacterium]